MKDDLLADHIDEALAGDLVVADEGVENVVAYLVVIAFGDDGRRDGGKLHHRAFVTLIPPSLSLQGFGNAIVTLLLQGTVEGLIEGTGHTASFDIKEKMRVVHGFLIQLDHLIQEKSVPQPISDMILRAKGAEQTIDEVVDKNDGLADV